MTNSQQLSKTRAWQRIQQANPEPWVLQHVASVEGLASAMAAAAIRTGASVDANLVSCGALLHDIGRAVTHDISHAAIGARMLSEDAQWPPPLIEIVRKHTGAGLLPAEAAQAGLPDGDYVPRALEEKLVAHADNLFSGSKRLTISQVQKKYESKGLPDAGRRIANLHEELEGVLDVNLDNLPSTASFSL